MGSTIQLDSSLRGKLVPDFLAAFCESEPRVLGLRFATYRVEPKLSERLQNVLTGREKQLRDRAVAVCHDNGIPFWDALFGISMGASDIPERFLEVAFSHSAAPPEKSFQLERSDVSSQSISALVQRIPKGLGLVVSSRILEKNARNRWHIPMLDLRCPTTEGNSRAVLKILEILGHKRGILAESGRSYHFYGTKLLSNSEWRSFMGKALLFSPVTDPRYIAHRLIDGECRLKIIDSANGVTPRVSHVF